jgi:hypothetical protein
MFEKLGNYQNISKIWKRQFQIRKNENFGKKRLTQGLNKKGDLNLVSFKLSSKANFYNVEEAIFENLLSFHLPLNHNDYILDRLLISL